MIQNENPMGQGYFGPRGYHSNKLAKEPLGNAVYEL